MPLHMFRAWKVANKVFLKGGVVPLFRAFRRRYFRRLFWLIGFRILLLAKSRQIQMILDNPKGLFFFRPCIEYSASLFQRPQHLAGQLSSLGYSYVYGTPAVYEPAYLLREIGKSGSLWVTGLLEPLQEYLLRKYRGPMVVHLYAQDAHFNYDDIERWMSHGARILYEYVDALDERLNSAAEGIMERHQRILSDERIFVVSTASVLHQEVASRRSSRFSLITNGVDFDHFHLKKRPDLPVEMKAVQDFEYVLGYYGAFASWVDFELIIQLAERFPYACIVLIGADYDGTLSKYQAAFTSLKNVIIFGPIPYEVLPYYSAHFDVGLIPFRQNEITMATNPIKAFEYMASGMPIVSTDLPECRKYLSIETATNHQDFLEKTDRILRRGEIERAKSIAFQEARENSWRQKSIDILNVLKLSEGKS